MFYESMEEGYAQKRREPSLVTPGADEGEDKQQGPLSSPQDTNSGPEPAPSGGVAEWLNAAVFKTARLSRSRGFESHRLRQTPLRPTCS